MSWVRLLAKKVFKGRLPDVSPEKASKYMDITRIIYFFSASTLCIMMFKKYNQQKERMLVSGQPVIEDINPAFRRARESGQKSGIIWDIGWDGIKKHEYHRDEYLQVLEKQTLEKAKESQKKAIEEGRELPPDAIRLV